MKKPEIIADFPVGKIHPNEANPRTITDKARKHLSDSLSRFGVVEPLVVNKRADGSHVLVSGHQRLDALKASGEKTALVSVVELDATDEKALGLRLNGHAGEWDQDRLEIILRELASEGEDITALGIGPQRAMERMLAESNAAGENIEEVPPTVLEIIVSCDSEAEQQALYERLITEGLRCRVLSM